MAKNKPKNTRVVKKISDKTPQNNQGTKPSKVGGNADGTGNGSAGRFKKNGSSY